MTDHAIFSRPAPTASLSAQEFLRWYWLKTELQQFARALGISAAGGKEDITARIAAVLGGDPAPVPPPQRRVPRTSGRQLAGSVHAGTVVPAGQRCSQVLRAWFQAEVGPGFRFDEPMREFFAVADGTTTLGDALAHWYASRNDAPREISGQFEFNRFTRRWHRDHPGGNRRDLLSAWQVYRSLPRDERELRLTDS